MCGNKRAEANIRRGVGMAVCVVVGVVVEWRIGMYMHVYKMRVVGGGEDVITYTLPIAAFFVARRLRLALVCDDDV